MSREDIVTSLMLPENAPCGWLPGILVRIEPDEADLLERVRAAVSNRTALAMVFKLLEAAQKSWRRRDGHNQLPKLVLGVTFNDGIEVVAKPTDRQPTTAAA